MSRMSRTRLRAHALAGVAAVATFGATAAAAQADVTRTSTYTCTLPYVGSQPVTIKLDAAIPSTVVRDPITGAVKPWPIKEALELGGDSAKMVGILGAASLSATISERGEFYGSNFTSSAEAALTIPRTDVADTGNLTLNATGLITPENVTADGSAMVFLGRAFGIKLSAFDADGKLLLIPGITDTDQDPVFTAELGCAMSPSSQDSKLADVQVVHGDPIFLGPPGTPKVSAITSTSATLTWAPPLSGTAVSYGVYSGSTLISTTTKLSAVLTGLTPGTAYSMVVKAQDAAGNVSAASPPVSFKIPCPFGCGITSSYRAVGTATVKTLVKGSFALFGSLNAMVDSGRDSLSGELKLEPADAKLTALGFLPVTAKVAIVPTAPLEGTGLSGGLTALSTKVRVKLASVTLFGLKLDSGTTCQTKSVSALTLKSSGAPFTVNAGGAFAGTFAISDLTGCGSLNGVLSSLTKGTGNAIAIQLTPPPMAVATVQ